MGKIDNGIVSVNAYGTYENITFPLIHTINQFQPLVVSKKVVLRSRSVGAS
jgi:hypothetical protein